jgi:AraC-like DNA-binding protein
MSANHIANSTSHLHLAPRQPASRHPQAGNGNRVAARRHTLGLLVHGPPASFRTPATETCYHVNLTTKGRTFAERADGTTTMTDAPSGLVLLPEQAGVVHWTPEAEQLVLKIPRSRLEFHLAELIGQPVVDVVPFGLAFDLRTPCGRSLLAAVKFLAGELERPGGLRDVPLAREQLEAYVMTQVLLAARNPFTEVLTGSAQPATGSPIASVLDHMERNLEQRLTPQDLARVGCMSVRGLHAAFQRDLGVSPMAHLRRMRLDHVHADLLHGPARVMQVSDVAMRWGLFHPSRFARQYQDRFGELPSETLRRRAY